MLPLKKILVTAGCVTLVSATLAFGHHPPQWSASPDQLSGPVRALPAHVGHLLEDMQIDLRRAPGSAHLLDGAREVLDQAKHLATSFDQGTDTNHLARDFLEFDAKWHHLAGQLRQLARAGRHAQLAASRVAESDAQLHRSLGVAMPVDMQEVRRLSPAVVRSAAHLRDDVETDLGDIPGYGGIIEGASRFADAADHFDRSLADGVDAEHARSDFGGLDEAWQQLSNGLYHLSPYRFEHLHEAASRVAPLVRQLGMALGTLPEPIPSVRPFSDLRTRSVAAGLEEFDLDLECSPWWAEPRIVIVPDDDGADEFDVPLDERFSSGPRAPSRGESGSIEPATPRRRFDLLPPRQVPTPSSPQDVRPRAATPAQGSPEPSDGHSHSHGDGHDHSHAVAPPAPKPARPAPGAAKMPAPRPAEPELDADARANLAKLSPPDREAALAQRVCPVTGDALGAMGVAFKVRVQGRDVFVCCKGCAAKVRKEPDKYLPNIKQ